MMVGFMINLAIMPEFNGVSEQEYADGLDLPHVFTPNDGPETRMFDWPQNEDQEENFADLLYLLNEFASQISLPFDYPKALLDSYDNPNIDDRVTEVVMPLLEELRVSDPELNIQGFWSVPASTDLDHYLVDVVVLCGDDSGLFLVPLQLTANYKLAFNKMHKIRNWYGSSHVIPVVWSEKNGQTRLSDDLIKSRLTRALLLAKGKVRLEANVDLK